MDGVDMNLRPFPFILILPLNWEDLFEVEYWGHLWKQWISQLLMAGDVTQKTAIGRNDWRM
jgi:hypothetical protein